MITISGLTQKQKALMDVMWQFQEIEDVNRFISTLPPRDQQDCKSLLTIAVQETQEHELNQLDAYESIAIDLIARVSSR